MSNGFEVGIMVQQVTAPLPLPGNRYPMSFAEYMALSETEGLRIEWVDGEAIVFMSTLYRHAQLSSFLVGLFSAFIHLYDLGEILFEQMGMEISARPSIRLPDMMIVLKEHRDRISRELVRGAADFIAEIVSEDSVTRDRRDKFREYALAGVTEYLWVDGRPERSGFGFFRLDASGTYQPVQPDAEGRYHSEVLPGFWFDPKWFDADPLPNTLRLLRTITPDGWLRFTGGDNTND
jgi:Uma2 family endonuclease